MIFVMLKAVIVRSLSLPLCVWVFHKSDLDTGQLCDVPNYIIIFNNWVIPTVFILHQLYMSVCLPTLSNNTAYVWGEIRL